MSHTTGSQSVENVRQNNIWYTIWIRIDTLSGFMTGDIIMTIITNIKPSGSGLKHRTVSSDAVLLLQSVCTSTIISRVYLPSFNMEKQFLCVILNYGQC
jgi:hypothetical protein